MSSEDDEEWAERLHERLRQQRAAALAAAKAEAAQLGKEPFDLDRFDAYLHPPDNREHGTREELIADYEYQYYVQHRHVHTLEEFAELLMRLATY